jgi:lipoprotein-anchoring transpeptidase ErfK/SrfK
MVTEPLDGQPSPVRGNSARSAGGSAGSGYRCHGMRFASVLGSIVVLAGASASAAVSANAQRVFVLEQRAVAHAEPAPGARRLAVLAALRPLTGSATVLPIVGRRLGGDGAWWVRVRLPARPNRSTGWVRETAGRESATHWSIVVDRSDRRASVLQDGRLRASFPVVVGARETPSPLGTFFVTEKLRLGLDVPQGPWALATSAYSDVLGEFAGGPGQIALHGRVGLPEPLGSAASHGCIRFSNAAISWLAERVAAGSRIIIRR